MRDFLEDVEGLCNARLYIGDDYGDNEATMRCKLPAGHEGRHEKHFTRSTFLPPGSQTVIITWELCERKDEEARDAAAPPDEDDETHRESSDEMP